MGHGKSKALTDADIDELTLSTNFEADEIRAWYVSFRKTCPSGILTLKEFKKLYGEFFPEGDASLFAKHAFRTFDKNGDGRLDFREFMVALSVTSVASFDDKLGWACAMYDVDSDGYVTKKEMLEIVKSIYTMMGEERLAEVMEDSLSPQQRVENFLKKSRVQDKMSIQEFRRAVSEDLSMLMLLQAGGST